MLRQGLRREHRFLVAAVCTLCDAALIALGTAGCGGLIAHIPLLKTVAAWAAAVFLFVYGLRAFRSAAEPSVWEDAHAGPTRSTRGTVVRTTLAFSLLNPHAVLDTVVLIGGLSAQYASRARPFFAAGAMTASLLWFFSLSYGAALLAPLFQRRIAWRVLDVGIGVTLWTLAATLIAGKLG